MERRRNDLREIELHVQVGKTAKSHGAEAEQPARDRVARPGREDREVVRFQRGDVCVRPARALERGRDEARGRGRHAQGGKTAKSPGAGAGRGAR